MLIQKEDTLKGNCGPEIEESEYSGDNLATQYQSMIEILRWSVGVRRVDLATKFLILSSFRLPLCEKYVETAHRIYI